MERPGDPSAATPRPGFDLGDDDRGDERMAKILCIEDEEDLRETIVEELEDAGHEVFEAGNGKLGLDAVQKRNPDLILCDINMPEMDGHTLVRNLREKYPKYAETPFIFLTAFADRADMIQGLNLGADDYLTKPIDFEMLILKVDTALRQRQRMLKKKEREQVALYQALSAKPKEVEWKDKEKEENKPPPKMVYKSGSTLLPETRAALEEMERRGGKAAVNGARVIDLGEIKQAMATEWGRVSAQARAIAERAIKSCLSPKDLMSRYGDDAFLVYFSGLDEKSSTLRAEMIADEIRKRLLGEDSAGFAGGSGGSRTRQGGKPNGKDSAKVEPAAPSCASAPSKVKAESIQPCPPEGVDHGNSEPIDDGEPDPWQAVADQMGLRFHPVWAPKKHEIIAARCQPVRRTPYGLVTGSTVLHGGDSDPLAPHLDLFILENLVERFTAKEKAENRAPVMVPLHFSTFFGAHKNTVCELLSSRAGRFQKGLIIELCGVPDIVAESRVWEAMGACKQYCRAVSVQTSLEANHTEAFRQAHATILHCDIGNGSQPGGDEKVNLRLIKSFADFANNRGLMSCVHGINTLDRLRLAIHSQVSFASGDSILPASDHPSDLRRLSEQEILKVA